MTQALTVARPEGTLERFGPFRLVPASLGEAQEMARLIAASDLCPTAYRGKFADCIVAYEYGAALGLSWLQSLRSIAVINGQGSLWGDAVPALILGTKECERLHETFTGREFDDDFTAVCTMRRKGYPDEVVRTFSVSDAKRAGLWMKQGRNGGSTPWVTYPKRMLQMRARGFAARDLFADKLSGLIIAEEAMDFPDAIPGEVVPEGQTSVELLARVKDDDVRSQVVKAFETLNMGVTSDAGFKPTGLGLTKLTEFLGGDADPELGASALLEWCKDEYAKRKTGQPRKPNGDSNAKKPTVEPVAKTDSPPTADEVFRKTPPVVQDLGF